MNDKLQQKYFVCIFPDFWWDDEKDEVGESEGVLTFIICQNIRAYIQISILLSERKHIDDDDNHSSW